MEVQKQSDVAFNLQNKILTGGEKRYTEQYTKRSEELNDYLGNNGRGYRKGQFTDQIKNLDSALDKFTMDRDAVVYRSTESKFFEKFNAGDIAPQKTYQSTSFKKEIAESFAQYNDDPVMLEIRVPKGTKGLYIGDNTDFKGGNQFELLLKRNVKYKILERSRRYLLLEVIG